MSYNRFVLIFIVFLQFQKCFTSNTEQIVNNILSILSSGKASNYIGEPISQLDHALQCAQLAVDEKSSPELIITALLHDIGHLYADKTAQVMSIYGIARHEIIGAKFVLESGFSAKVADLIANHVNAKRYLTYKYKSYLERLSEASKNTLIKQGGPMTKEEAEEFEKHPFFNERLKIREWDDKAKEVGRKVLPLDYYSDILIRYLEQQKMLQEKSSKP